MNRPIRRRPASGGRLFGCRQTPASPPVAEAPACAGFDSRVVDGEHSPADPTDTAARLQAPAAARG